MATTPCPRCGAHEQWRWLDGRPLCRPCLIQGGTPIVAVNMWSEVLQSAVWVVVDDLPQQAWPADAAVYTHAEVTLLSHVGPDTLRWCRPSKRYVTGV